MRSLAIPAILLLLSLVAVTQAREVPLFHGDSITIPDSWEFHMGDPLPQNQPGTIFTAGSKRGCGLRIDSAGVSQEETAFTTSATQFDDYLDQLFARSDIRIRHSAPSKLEKVAGFRALEKRYSFELQGVVRQARMLQFNSKTHLYNAGLISSSQELELECFNEGEQILSTFKSVDVAPTDQQGKKPGEKTELMEH